MPAPVAVDVNPTAWTAALRNAAAAVLATAFRAKDAGAGAGSSVTVGGGAGAIAGTDLPGNVDTDLGTPVANQSGKQRWIAGGAAIGEVSLPGLSNRLGIAAVGAATIVRISGATGFELQAGGATIMDVGVSQTGKPTFSADTIFVSLSIASFLMTQPTKTSDAAASTWTIAPQAPFVTATGQNRIGGGFVVRLAPQSNGGGSGVVDSTAVSARWEASGATVLRRVELQNDRVQTTDASVNVVAAQRTLADNTIEVYDVVFTARKPATGDCAAYIRRAAYKRTGGGGAGIVGALDTGSTFEDAAIAACDVSLQTSGNALKPSVTGIAATTIEWTVTLRTVTSTP